MDYPVQLASQLQQLLKSLRKSRQMTQADLARRLGVVQSRVADIERDPGAVSVEQLMQVLALLGAQVVVRDLSASPSATTSATEKTQATSRARAAANAAQTSVAEPPGPAYGNRDGGLTDDEPRGQW